MSSKSKGNFYLHVIVSTFKFNFAIYSVKLNLHKILVYFFRLEWRNVDFSRKRRLYCYRGQTKLMHTQINCCTLGVKCMWYEDTGIASGRYTKSSFQEQWVHTFRLLTDFYPSWIARNLRQTSFQDNCE